MKVVTHRIRGPDFKRVVSTLQGAVHLSITVWIEELMGFLPWHYKQSRIFCKNNVELFIS